MTGTEVDHFHGGLYGDATGRIGYTFNRALIYAKGGFAFVDGNVSTSTGVAGFTLNSASMFTGWTVGGGVEYMVAPNWSMKLEYQHLDFGAKFPNLTAGGAVFPYRNDVTAETVKFGINYLFSWAPPPAPVVAKY